MNPETFGLAYAAGGFRGTTSVLRRRGMSVDSARDIAQQGWLIAFVRRNELRDHGSLQGWVNRIAINLWIDSKRVDLQRGGRMSAPSPDGRDLAVPPGVNLAALDAETALAGISVRQRTLLRLVYIEQESIRDVARLLSISVPTLHTRLSRARKAARRSLERAA